MYFIKFRMLYSCGKFILVSMTARFPFVVLPKNDVMLERGEISLPVKWAYMEG